nr:PREDICTED: OV-16 antigen-like [Bemisia tabaci]
MATEKSRQEYIESNCKTSAVDMPLSNYFTRGIFRKICVFSICAHLSLADNKNGHGKGHDSGSRKGANEQNLTAEAERAHKILSNMFDPELHKDGIDYPFKNHSEILHSPPDPDDEVEQTRPLPRDKTLIWAYLRMHQVVPDVVPLVAKDAIEVTYKDDAIVDFGAELSEDQVENQPINTTWPVEKGAHYTLILFTPDSPSRFDQTEGQFVLWFVADINDSCKAKSGKTYTKYLGPKAWTKKPELLGELRRFIYIVFKQPETPLRYKMGTTYKENTVAFDSRQLFNLTKFVHENKLGRPTAINMFQMSTVKQKRNWTVI